jgi:hypothetical protein
VETFLFSPRMALWLALIISGTCVEEGAVVGVFRFRCHRYILLRHVAVVTL